jgi:dUTP pyrophosphatase
MQIKIKYHAQGLDKIAAIKKGDWIDLRAAETVSLKKGELKYISLGVSMKLPEGYEAQWRQEARLSRTGAFIQANSLGIIDNSYSGTNDIWKFPAYALRDTVIEKNERICHFRLVEKMPEVDSSR